MSFFDQARAAVRSSEIVAQRVFFFSDDDRVRPEKRWTHEMMNSWILSHYADKIKDEDQIEKIYTTKAIIGQFAGDVHIVDDSNSGRAFMRTERGPVTLTRGPVSWNPVDGHMLSQLC